MTGLVPFFALLHHIQHDLLAKGPCDELAQRDCNWQLQLQLHVLSYW